MGKPSAPVVSLPEAKPSSGSQTPSVPVQTRATLETGMLPRVTEESVTPAQFGAAYLNNPKPIYPPPAKRMGMEGTIMLKVFVSREGTVIRCEVVRSAGRKILDNAAVEQNELNISGGFRCIYLMVT
jgi:protein TonB